jgi:8-amino-7-oxononanoate synthase
MGPNALRNIEAGLRELEAEGLLRSPLHVQPGCLVLSSNDYLGYARRPIDGRAEAGGSGSSRLIAGDSETHRAAERALSEWVGAESALLFTSGYAANVGLMSALAGPEDAVVSDALNHASIIDGCRLSRARVTVVPHLDTSAVEHALREASGARRRWVVTESYFSMDADSPDLRTLRRLCDAHDAGLVVDEAHALGVFGPGGAGLCADAGVVPDALVGTLGKAVGLQGAFVAGREALRRWLWNRARSFVFSTGVSPLLAAATGDRVREVRADDAARTRLGTVASALRDAISGGGGKVLGYGPIVPWMVGSATRALELAAVLLERGVSVPAIRPPTVAVGSSRLRVSASAALTDDEVLRATRSISDLCQSFRDVSRDT